MSAKIEKITIENYRSFGSDNNSIFMSDDVIAIVGKNGSGKSNILSALDNLQFFRGENHETLDNCNTFLSDDEEKPRPKVKISFIVSISPADVENIVPDLLRNELRNERVQFDFFRYNSWGYFMKFRTVSEKSDDEPCIFTRILNSDKKLVEYFSLLQKNLKNDTSSPNGNERDKHSGILYWSENWDRLHSIPDYKWIDNHYRNAVSEEKLNYIHETYDRYMNIFANIMPRIFVYKDLQLYDVYTKDELTKDHQKFFSTPSALAYLIGAIGVKKSDFLQAMEDPQVSYPCKSVRRRIQRLINDFNEEFNKFYNNSKEKIELSLDFDNNRCFLNVASDDKDQTFKISERSNGLKWYLAFFAALRHAKTLRNALILIDEPAVHLHVDAQKEVLSLFNNLSKNNLQIIYTTHSPAMLDVNSWERIRLVEKQNNVSRIFGIQSSHAGIQHLETLSPIQQAMGCCLKNTLAPDSKRCNIITEGITDYYYIKAMFKILGVPDDCCYIIPAGGAQTIPNTLFILYGWGYNVKVLLDNDKEGQKVAEKIKKAFPEDFNQIVTFVSSIAGTTIENLLCAEDLGHFQKTKPDGSFCKVSTALSFMRNAETTEYQISEPTKNNFRNLFASLGIKCNATDTGKNEMT